MVHPEIQSYNDRQSPDDKQLCDLLAKTIESVLTAADSKIWHAHPVWFIEGNPIVGYRRQKAGWRLMFWSGASFQEAALNVTGEKFKDASIFYQSRDEIRTKDLKRWLKKSIDIQWDYKNIVKRKGRLERVNPAEKDSAKKGPKTHDERIAEMTFATVYPLYLAKVEKKGRSQEELHHVIQWLTGFGTKEIQQFIKKKSSFDEFFQKASLNPCASLITGTICGYRIEEIENPLTRQVRYLDKLVDELAKGRKMEKILRSS